MMMYNLAIPTLFCVATLAIAAYLLSEYHNPTDDKLPQYNGSYFVSRSASDMRCSQRQKTPLLLTFAHNCCKNSIKRNCQSGLSHGFAECQARSMDYVKEDVQFYMRNCDILNMKRGAGYWLWKPYIIWRALEESCEGDIIFYSDAAAEFIADVNPLLELTNQQDIVTFSLGPFRDGQWTKRDTFLLMGCDTVEFAESSQTMASFIIIKSSKSSRQFISEWLHYSQDRRSISDDPNALGHPNYPNFAEHRHDQSILSLLVKKWKLKTYRDPSQNGNGSINPSTGNYSQIINHTRKRW